MDDRGDTKLRATWRRRPGLIVDAQRAFAWRRRPGARRRYNTAEAGG